MDAFDRKLRRAARRERQEIPAWVQKRILRMLSELPPKPFRSTHSVKNRFCMFPVSAVPFSNGPAAQCAGTRRRGKRILAGVAAALALFIALPNLSRQAAAAMRELPVIGGLVEVILVRNYLYDDSYHYADISVPQVTVEESGDGALEKSVQEINEEVESLTERLIAQFEADAEQIGEEGHTELDVYYETVTDNSDWFTLEVEIYYGSGSGTVNYKYYHIDKATGQIMRLSDLFQEGGEYITAISDWIAARMREQMAAGTDVYWIDNELAGTEFHTIDPNQNFFFAENGNLVIQFDEYEVAPGSGGTPRFEIPRDVYEEFLKEGY